MTLKKRMNQNLDERIKDFEAHVKDMEKGDFRGDSNKSIKWKENFLSRQKGFLDALKVIKSDLNNKPKTKPQIIKPKLGKKLR